MNTAVIIVVIVYLQYLEEENGKKEVLEHDLLCMSDMAAIIE